MNPGNNKTVGLIACSKQKLDHKALARDLYTSPLFRRSRAYVEAHCFDWAILSAKHGLVRTRMLIEPYELRLSDLSRTQRRLWAEETRQAIVTAWGDGMTFLVLAGAEYMGAVRGLNVKNPLAGMSIGLRLRWLNNQLRGV